jgi:hypothetical protein
MPRPTPSTAGAVDSPRINAARIDEQTALLSTPMTADRGMSGGTVLRAPSLEDVSPQHGHVPGFDDVSSFGLLEGWLEEHAYCYRQHSNSPLITRLGRVPGRSCWHVNNPRVR